MIIMINDKDNQLYKKKVDRLDLFECRKILANKKVDETTVRKQPNNIDHKA